MLEVLDGWVKINVDSDEGYVSSDYVEISTELLKAMTMTEIRYGQGVSDVRVSLVQYGDTVCRQSVCMGRYKLNQRCRTVPALFMSVFANYGISLPHSPVRSQTVERRSLLQRHSREICSSTETEAASTTWQSTSATDRWYMQVRRSLASRFPVPITVRRSKLCV